MAQVDVNIKIKIKIKIRMGVGGRYDVGVDDHLSKVVYEEGGQPCL